MASERKITSMSERMALVKRIEAGAVRRELAEECGLSKGYLRRLWRDYQTYGEAAFAERKKDGGPGRGSTGRKKQRAITPEEKVAMRDLLKKSPTPAAAGIEGNATGGGKGWTVKTLAKLMRREWGFSPIRQTVFDLLEEWEMDVLEPMTPPGMTPVPGDEFDPVRERERELRVVLNVRMAEEGKHEYQLIGMPRGARGHVGPQWRKRNPDPLRSQTFALEFWTDSPERLLTEGSKQLLKRRLRSLGLFSGVKTLSYVILDSHCFVVVEVPGRDRWMKRLAKSEVLLSRADLLYGKASMVKVRRTLELAGDSAKEKIYERLRAGFCDLSKFVKMAKESVARGHNRQVHAAGSLWVPRFRSLELKTPDEIREACLRANRWPLTRGLVTAEELADYPWCSFHDAVNRNKQSREGIGRCFGKSRERWDEGFMKEFSDEVMGGSQPDGAD